MAAALEGAWGGVLCRTSPKAPLRSAGYDVACFWRGTWRRGGHAAGKGAWCKVRENAAAGAALRRRAAQEFERRLRAHTPGRCAAGLFAGADDVFTTGSNMEECKPEPWEKGRRRAVYALTAAVTRFGV